MGLRIVSKVGVVLSVILFVMAVGMYAFYYLDTTRKEQNIDLHTLVPDDCLGIMETDNIHYYFNEFSELNYNDEMFSLPSSGLFGSLIQALHDYTLTKAHGLSSRTREMQVSFHGTSEVLDQVVYMKIGPSDRSFFQKLLQGVTAESFSPKKDKYRGETIYVYSLKDQRFLSVYSKHGYLVASYQKRLVEKVIDTMKDKSSVVTDKVFRKAVQRKKSNNYLSLYLKAAPMVSLRKSGNWTEFDVHVNSDVLYLTGETYCEDSVFCMKDFEKALEQCTNLRADSVMMTVNPMYLEQCIREKQLKQMDEEAKMTLFDSSVSNLSKEAFFTFVADVDCILKNPDKYGDFLPRFLMYNAQELNSFIVSSQLFLQDEHMSHIIVLTYKN